MKNITLSADEKLIEAAHARAQAEHTTLDELFRLDTDQTRAYLEAVLAPLFQVSASIPLYQRALDIKARYHYGFYDSLIIAAALEAGCTRLYSEDLQHGQRIQRLTIENPFLGG